MAPKKILRFGIPLFFSGIAFTLMSKVDVLLIEYYTLSENVGIYNAALMLSGLISLPLTGLNQAISPMISDLYNRDEIDKLITTLQISTRWISMIGLGSGLILFLFSDEIILLWGTDYLAGSIFLSILVIPKAVNAVTGSSGFVLQMTGHQDLSFLNNILSLIINIVLDVILIPRFGPIGAAVGTAIALSLNNILCLIEVYWKVGLPMYDLSILRIFVSTIIVFVVGYLLESLGINWILQLVIVSFLYLSVTILLMTKQDKEFLAKVVGRI
jgi:O-antigen/teichoic acid export membrane protein